MIGDAEAANSTGYGRSKMVAEMICAAIARKGRMRGRVSVVRVGQLSGSRETGVWNESEAYPAMMSAGALLGGGGVLPDLDAVRASQGKGAEVCGWVPVDVAARSFFEAAVGVDLRESGIRDGVGKMRIGVCDAEGAGGSGADVEVVHLLSSPPVADSEVPTWSTLLGHLRKHTHFSTLPMSQWLDRVEASEELRKREHPALRLVGFWREVYAVPLRESSRESHEDEDKPGKGKGNGEIVGDGKHEDGFVRRQVATVSENGLEESGVAGNTGTIAALADNAVGDSAGTSVGDETVPTSSGFVMTKSLQAMPSLQEAGGLDEEYVLKMWRWIQQNVGAVSDEKVDATAEGVEEVGGPSKV